MGFGLVLGKGFWICDFLVVGNVYISWNCYFFTYGLRPPHCPGHLKSWAMGTDLI